MLGKAFGGRTKKRKMTVAEEHQTLLTARKRQAARPGRPRARCGRQMAEKNGIVFIDEIDKITARSEYHARRRREPRGRAARPAAADRGHHGDHQARAGEDRPCPVHRSGAFHLAKPSDLLPELQGRLPIRVELASLSRDDFRRILTEPEASLLKQYTALMATEKVDARLQADDAIDALADCRPTSTHRSRTSGRAGCTR
jgi:ATP-dependent HslUV protease ATP-binding subunit HslU